MQLFSNPLAMQAKFGVLYISINPIGWWTRKYSMILNEGPHVLKLTKSSPKILIYNDYILTYVNSDARFLVNSNSTVIRYLYSDLWQR